MPRVVVSAAQVNATTAWKDAEDFIAAPGSNKRLVIDAVVIGPSVGNTSPGQFFVAVNQGTPQNTDPLTGPLGGGDITELHNYVFGPYGVGADANRAVWVTYKARRAGNYIVSIFSHVESV